MSDIPSSSNSNTAAATTLTQLFSGAGSTNASDKTSNTSAVSTAGGTTTTAPVPGKTVNPLTVDKPTSTAPQTQAAALGTPATLEAPASQSSETVSTNTTQTSTNMVSMGSNNTDYLSFTAMANMIASLMNQLNLTLATQQQATIQSTLSQAQAGFSQAAQTAKAGVAEFQAAMAGLCISVAGAGGAVAGAGSSAKMADEASLQQTDVNTTEATAAAEKASFSASNAAARPTPKNIKVANDDATVAKMASAKPGVKPAVKTQTEEVAAQTKQSAYHAEEAQKQAITGKSSENYKPLQKTNPDTGELMTKPDPNDLTKTVPDTYTPEEAAQVCATKATAASAKASGIHDTDTAYSMGQKSVASAKLAASKPTPENIQTAKDDAYAAHVAANKPMVNPTVGKDVNNVAYSSKGIADKLDADPKANTTTEVAELNASSKTSVDSYKNVQNLQGKGAPTPKSELYYSTLNAGMQRFQIMNTVTQSLSSTITASGAMAAASYNAQAGRDAATAQVYGQDTSTMNTGLQQTEALADALRQSSTQITGAQSTVVQMVRGSS